MDGQLRDAIVKVCMELADGLLFYDLGVVYRGVKGRRPRRAMVQTLGEFSDGGEFVEYYVVWYWTGRGRQRSRVLCGVAPARRMMDKWLGDGAREVVR